MKKYIKPEIDIENMVEEDIICTSPGVETGKSLGNEYSSTDESYSKDRSNYMHQDLGWDF